MHLGLHVLCGVSQPPRSWRRTGFGGTARTGQTALVGREHFIVVEKEDQKLPGRGLSRGQEKRGAEPARQ